MSLEWVEEAKNPCPGDGRRAQSTRVQHPAAEVFLGALSGHVETSSNPARPPIQRVTLDLPLCLSEPQFSHLLSGGRWVAISKAGVNIRDKVCKVFGTLEMLTDF